MLCSVLTHIHILKLYFAKSYRKEKMAQGRGLSAMFVLLCVLVLLSEMSHATTYVVGDDKGCSFIVFFKH